MTETTRVTVTCACGHRSEHNCPTPPPATEPPTPLPDYIEIAQYRHDHGHQAWAWRCWGDGPCDGWLALDKTSEETARQGAVRHLAEDHQPPASA